MKRIAPLLLLLVLALPSGLIIAQEQIDTIDTLTVDLLPDFDRPSVLVLITGMLPAETPLPATVSLPLPEGSDFNVVARIDAADGRMKDDIEFSINDGEIAFITPDLQFRLEYYYPYSADGSQRTFSYNWLSDESVNEFDLNVQVPSAASDFTTNPTAVDIFNGEDGFTYHILPTEGISANQSYAVQVSYTMDRDELSIGNAAPSITDVQTTGFSPTESASNDIDWPIIAAAGGGVLVILGLIWQITSSRGKNRTRKPKPIRQAASKSDSQYCHICGQPIQGTDKFCRECGTARKSI